MKPVKRFRKLFLPGLIMLAFTSLSQAGMIRLGLFSGQDIQSVVFSVIEGEYILTGDAQQVAVIRKGNMFHIELTRSRVTVHDTSQLYGTYSKLEFKGVSAGNIFQIKPVYPSLPSKESEDNLMLDVRENALRLINILDLEKYIPGTIEAEGGPNASAEFYKAQAVLSRTYAIRNFARHAHEGFNLCDAVHCQAFNGKSRMNPMIYRAVDETRNEILVDQEGKPIFTAFHANCGGITSSASMTWNRDLPYLISVHDPFCDASSRHDWKKMISRKEWNDYLNKKSLAADVNTYHKLSEPGRHKYLEAGQQKLLLTTIREDLNLRSSFFILVLTDESVTIQGHGYGHGAGMCQEGAMEMARVGYTYMDILMFYFYPVRLEKR